MKEMLVTWKWKMNIEMGEFMRNESEEKTEAKINGMEW